EPTPTITGAMADHRLPLRAREVAEVAQAVAHGLGIEGVPAPSGGVAEAQAAWIDAVVGDLKAHRGSGLVLAGDTQPAAVHALAHAINGALDNAGKTVILTDPVEA